MKEFGGKVAVVTGGGQGIGRALVERFTDEGMKAVVADVVPELVEQTTAELCDQGRDVVGVVTDVTSLESVEALRDATLDAFGAVHVVCNNAGIGSGSEGQIWEHHVNDWRWSTASMPSCWPPAGIRARSSRSATRPGPGSWPAVRHWVR